MELICRVCGQQKPSDQFYETRKGSGKPSSRCKECTKAAALNWWKNHREQAAETARKRLPRLRKQKLSYQRKRMRELRTLAMTHYSGGLPKCACCGEAAYEFLTISSTSQSKTETACAQITVERLIKEGYPKGYRVLCYNCSYSTLHYGYCPHQSRGA